MVDIYYSLILRVRMTKTIFGIYTAVERIKFFLMHVIGRCFEVFDVYEDT